MKNVENITVKLFINTNMIYEILKIFQMNIFKNKLTLLKTL